MTALMLDEPMMVEPAMATADRVDELDDVRGLFNALTGALRSRLQGCDDAIDLVVTAVLADGHVLLESQPGSGKTELANTLGRCIAREPGSDYASFRRIQFTPDLMPSDVTGTSIFDPETQSLAFRPGPVFANIVLADEINRTSPKVQASLLEAMAEKQVTVDNHTHTLEDVFVVLATQNPIDMSGTFPLPRAQLDRFLFKVVLPRLARDKQLEVLTKRKSRPGTPKVAIAPDAIVRAREVLANDVCVSPVIHECLVDLAEALHADPRVALSLSTRALVLAIPTLQAWAAVHGRDYVTPRDIKALAVPLFAHRLELTAGTKDAAAVVNQCLAPCVESATRRSLKG